MVRVMMKLIICLFYIFGGYVVFFCVFFRREIFLFEVCIDLYCFDCIFIVGCLMVFDVLISGVFLEI